MLRECDLKDISDGRLYGLNDMVKAYCDDCKGCHKCCTQMGNSIVLDPYDIYRLCKCTGKGFQELIGNAIALSLFDGVILPYMAMTPDSDRCYFLNAEGRCSIHESRPGMCRIFPLGRYYEEDGFSYFLQVHECTNTKRTKIKVKKWIDSEPIDINQKFVKDWHFFIKEKGMQTNSSPDQQSAKAIMMKILNTFFVTDYDLEKDFYGQFYERLEEF
jgi:hypothetical protein